MEAAALVVIHEMVVTVKQAKVDRLEMVLVAVAVVRWQIVVDIQSVAVV